MRSRIHAAVTAAETAEVERGLPSYQLYARLAALVLLLYRPPVGLPSRYRTVAAVRTVHTASTSRRWLLRGGCVAEAQGEAGHALVELTLNGEEVKGVRSILQT